MSDIKIELIEPKDVPELVVFFKNHFFKGEPNCVHLNIGSDCKELEDYCVVGVPENCSFKAVNSKGEIIGALANGIVLKSASSIPHAVYKNEKVKIIAKLLQFIDTQFNLFDLYPGVDKYMDGKLLVVDEVYRGQGIAGMLTERTIEYMRANNISVISMLCTSHFSGRVCEKLNFKREYALNYADYFVDGKNPTLPAEPHKAVQIFVHEIKD